MGKFYHLSMILAMFLRSLRCRRPRRNAARRAVHEGAVKVQYLKGFGLKFNSNIDDFRYWRASYADSSRVFDVVFTHP
jgi:hypothetical protein